MNTMGASPQITNLVLEDHTKEYKFTFNYWCKKFTLKARTKANVNVSLDDTFTNYITLPKGAIWWEDLVLCSISIWLQADIDNVVIEILEWSSKD